MNSIEEKDKKPTAYFAILKAEPHLGDLFEVKLFRNPRDFAAAVNKGDKYLKLDANVVEKSEMTALVQHIRKLYNMGMVETV